MIRVVVEAVAAYLAVVALLLLAWYGLKRRDREEEAIADARTRLCPPDDPDFIAWAAEQDNGTGES